jgi:hypothetical protein
MPDQPIYTARKVKDMPSKPGYWNTTVVGVFCGEEQIGDYHRNYPAFYDTFFPFQLKGQWYALYSQDYTCTSVMELPSCRLVASEEPSAYGFCPVDFYVARYQKRFEKGYSQQEMCERGIPEANWSRLSQDRTYEDYDLEDGCEVFYNTELAFVAGCVWGDDSSWKIERLDLRELEQGRIGRHNDLGYIEMPPKMQLVDCIHVVEGGAHFAITVRRYYRLGSGTVTPISL